MTERKEFTMVETNTTNKMNQPTTQRTYKDRLFKFIFGNEEYKEYALDLYNAVNGSSYEDVNELTFTTIDDILFMGMRNDVSFLVEANMTLYEQQSSACPNMPLRGLIYFGRVYDSYLKTHALNPHSRSLLPLPTPRFVVFYNGREARPVRQVLKLTDAVKSPQESAVEVTAIVENINSDAGNELLNRCQVLGEYSEFVGMVNHNMKLGMERTEAITRAVDEAITKGILRDILIKHKAEVIGMSLTEWNEEEFGRTMYEDGVKDGYANGEKVGYASGEKAGEKVGEEKTVYSFVAAGDISVEKGAEKLGITVEALFEKMRRAGYLVDRPKEES